MKNTGILFLGLFLATMTVAFAQDNKTVSVIILITGILGKLLSNLFAAK